MQIQEIQKRLPLVIAGAAGILAIMLLNTYIQRREGEMVEKVKLLQQEQAKTVEPAPAQMGIVLVAKKEIAAQTPIEPGDIEVKEVPVESIQKGTITSIEQVIGQISSAPFSEGEQILANKLMPPAKFGKKLSEITPQGKRAVAISVDNVASNTNLIKPGDHIDVYAFVSPPPAAGQSMEGAAKPRLMPLFQDVEVLAVGQDLVSKQSEKKEQSKGTAAGIFTLAVSPQEAILLSFVQEHGKIKLSLRASEDTLKEQIKPADWDALFEYLYPRPATDATGSLPTVEIYRGIKKEIVPLLDEEKK